MAIALDIRCAAVLPNSPAKRAAPEVGRCQLGMGHDGPHAVMFSRGDQRVVRTWGGRGHEPSRDRVAGFERLAWLRGFPTPVWVEPPLARPSGGPAPSATTVTTGRS